MKKLMTSTIILLPLLLLAIMLVSGAITSMITHVYVESVEFVENATLVLVMSDEENPPTEQLEVNVFPLKADSRDLVFSVDDKNIASVDQNGVLTAKFYGETYISVVSLENKAASARRKIIVTDTSVHELVINDGYDAEMYEDGTQQLSVTIYPQEAANKSVTWSSSDENILSVSANGTVTAKNAGTATITATSDDNGEVKASVEITGHKKISDIEVDQTLVVTSLTESKFPFVTPVPVDADVTLTFKTDKSDIATVDAAGNIHFKKEGHVVVTVTATDFGGKTVEKKKEYTSTDGYYLPPLFAQKEYTVDYDEYKNADKALPIPFAKTLDGSYREFISVKYSVDNVLSFDETTKEFRFSNPMPIGTRSLTATVRARIYEAATGTLTDYEDGFTLTVLRNATDISVSYKGTEKVASIQISGRTLTFTEEKQNNGSFAVIDPTPENHTNNIVYSLVMGGDVAEITQAGVLTFNKPGTAKVKISFADANGAEKAAKEIEVIYTPLEAREQEVEISEEEQKIVLMMNDGGADTGVIRFVSPENTTVSYTVEPNEDVVRLEGKNGVWRIVPVSGGFATVKVTVTPNARSAAAQEYFVKVYVDRPVQAEDFAVAFNSSPCADVYRTSFDSVAYSVAVTEKQGSMAGKKLYVSFRGTKNEAGDGILNHSGTVSFAGRDFVTVTFGVEYTAEAADLGAENGLYSISRKVTTSKGTLDDAPTVTYEGGTLQEAGTDLTFADIGKKIVLTVSKSFSPADFDLSCHRPSIDGTDYVGVNISEDGATITLTAQKVCSAQRMFLTIGGKTFVLNVTVRALAEKLTVTCGNSLNDGGHYKTLLDSLTFNVKIADREDGLAISNTGIQYSLDGSQWSDVKDGRVQITISSLTDGNLLRFRSADEGANMEFSVEKVALGDFGLEFSVQTSLGKSVVGKIKSIATESAISYSLPSDIHGVLTIKVTPEQSDLLGGFGTNEEFEKIISVTLPEKTDWETSYEASQSEIIIGGNFFGSYIEEISLKSERYTLTVELSHITLANVEFTGFESGKSEDVNKGYQQVRVFAKRSYYDGATVDYFRIPLVALEDLVKKTPVDPTLLTWKLTRYKGNETVDTVATQSGDKVTYGTAEYKIVQSGEQYILQTVDGTTVVGTDGKYVTGQKRVTWVDVYSEPNYARIYFGDFGGLSESDVQNDYFGNFGEQAVWMKKTPEGADNYDGSGRIFTPSANAYSFLRVEAGDGMKNGKNCHFNFNVLQDDALVNVFNAAGYYKNQKIVLHNDLYGPQENPDAPETQVLSQSTEVAKDTIYGNGHQVNIAAYNATMGSKNESTYITFYNLYNVRMMGDSANTTLDQNTQKVYFHARYVYYCDMSYYWKLAPAGDKAELPLYVKNTVFNCVPKTAIQIYYSSSLYAQNMTIVECGAGISVEFSNDNAESRKKDAHIYFKGDIDILDYNNKSGLDKMTNGMIGLFFGEVVNGIKDYLEWHGNTVPETKADAYGDNAIIDRYYTNVLIYSTYSMQGKVFSWNEEKGSYEVGTGATVEMPGNRTIVNKCLAFNAYFAWTYDYGNNLEGGTITTSGNGPKTKAERASMNDIFTDKRYIRLLCEYKKPGEKNTGHILWHRQEVYRDKSLILGRKNHLDDLKESLKGTTWDDGSGVDGNGDPYDPPAAAPAMNKLISQTVIPSKRAY